MTIFYNVDVFDMGPFSIKVDPDPLGDRWFRWSLFAEGQLVRRSQFSYATRREAKNAVGAEIRRQVNDDAAGLMVSEPSAAGVKSSA